MERRLVPRQLFGRLAIALLGTCVAGAQAAERLTQDQLDGDPAAVAAWLRVNASKADRKFALAAAKMGAEDKARGRWSAAAKGYGDSAISYPDPVTILGYARVVTLDLASVRAHDKRPDLIASDAKSFLKLYQVVQAAQGVTGTLSKDQVAEVDGAIRCLSMANAASQVITDCEPLRAYRSEFERVNKRR